VETEVVRMEGARTPTSVSTRGAIEAGRSRADAAGASGSRVPREATIIATEATNGASKVTSEDVGMGSPRPRGVIACWEQAGSKKRRVYSGGEEGGQRTIDSHQECTVGGGGRGRDSGGGGHNVSAPVSPPTPASGAAIVMNKKRLRDEFEGDTGAMGDAMGDGDGGGDGGAAAGIAASLPALARTHPAPPTTAVSAGARALVATVTKKIKCPGCQVKQTRQLRTDELIFRCEACKRKLSAPLSWFS